MNSTILKNVLPWHIIWNPLLRKKIWEVKHFLHKLVCLDFRKDKPSKRLSFKHKLKKYLDFFKNIIKSNHIFRILFFVPTYPNNNFWSFCFYFQNSENKKRKMNNKYYRIGFQMSPMLLHRQEGIEILFDYL